MSTQVIPMDDHLTFTERGILSFITHRESPYYVLSEHAGIVQVNKTELREPLREAFANTFRNRGHNFEEIARMYDRLPTLVTFRVKKS